LRTKDGDSYSFISVDMCPRPGLGRPLNFFGRLNEVKKKTIFEIKILFEIFRKKKKF